MNSLDTRLQQLGRIAIVGTGLLGGSIGLALRKLGYRGRIMGVGRRQETLDRARDRGCIDEVSTSPAHAAARSDLLILATPLGSFDQILREISHTACERLIITDVGSTKALVCADAQRLLPSALARRFIGSHPMAGKEVHGPDHACADLFDQAPCVVTPQDDVDPGALAVVEALWRSLGMRLIRMSAADHDRCVARISHLPHALAVLLVDLAAGQGGLDIASSGFRDTTRIASGDPDVWTDIFTTNRAACIEVIDAFISRLAGFRETLVKLDTEQLTALLERSKQTRDLWVKQLPQSEKVCK